MRENTMRKKKMAYKIDLLYSEAIIKLDRNLLRRYSSNGNKFMSKGF